MILTANNYLESSNHLEVILAVTTIMNCVIHLDGKKQITELNDDFAIKVNKYFQKSLFDLY